MSWQASLVRFYLRYGLKRRSRPSASVRGLRANIDKLSQYIPKPPRGVIEEQGQVGGVPGLWTTAPGVTAKRTILYLHGGGYVSASPATYRDLGWRLSAAAGARVLLLDYRLAPEHPFPAAIDDAVAAYRSLMNSGIPPSSLAIAGDSAGGGLALATMLVLRDQGIPLPAAACMFSPWTDLAGTGDSIKTNREADPFIHADAVLGTARWYLGNAAPETPLASPLYAELHGLPPTLVYVGSTEVLLDDSRRIVKKMAAAGSPVDLRIWPDMPHVWQLFAMLMPEGRTSLAEAGSFLAENMAAAEAAEAAAQTHGRASVPSRS